MTQKTILLSLPYGMSARNFLRNDFFQTLKQQHRLIIVSPLSSDPEFRAEFKGDNIEFRHLKQVDNLFLRFIQKGLFIIQAFEFTKKYPIETHLILKEQLKETEPIKYSGYFLLTQVALHIPFFLSFLLFLQDRFQYNEEAEQLLNDTKPDLVFITHGYVQVEIELALRAKQSGIPVINMIHSWDNLTCKSGLRQITNNYIGRRLPVGLFSKTVVWNKVLANELVDLYGVSPENIFLSGIPQFDIYQHIIESSSRKEYFNIIQGDPQKKTLYFIATSPTIIKDQLTVIRFLAETIRKGTFGPCQLLVRLHPKTDMSSWFDILKGPDVLFQQPSAAYGAIPISHGWQKEQTKTNDLGESLFHCDVVINGYSTTAIDAAVFDKPIICLGFDGQTSNQPMLNRYYQTTHYSKLLSRKGLQLATTPEELIQRITEYLNDPKKDSSGRAQIREDFCYKSDGKSGIRIAQYLSQTLEEFDRK